MQYQKAVAFATLLLIGFATVGSVAEYNPNPTATSNPHISFCSTLTSSDLTGVNVAIYEGYSVVRCIESRTALQNMFSWMNATVRIVNTSEIIEGILWDYDIFVVPEGLGPSLEYYLGEEGRSAIREYVSLGGSYFGVRGSAAMAVKKSYFESRNTTFKLGLFNGTSIEVADLSSTCITELNVNQDCTGPDLSSVSSSISVLFCTGRYFVADENQEMIVIANYSHNNLPCMIAFNYGSGCVFLSSPHPEYEENNDRDGTDYMDEYDDPDSEWPFMLTIARWLVDASTWATTFPSTTTESTNITTEDTQTTTMGGQTPLEIIIIGISLTSIIAIVVIVLYLKRR